MDPRVFRESDIPRTDFENEIVNETRRLLAAPARGMDPDQTKESWKVLLEKCEKDGIWFIDARDAFWVFGSAYFEGVNHGHPDLTLSLKVLNHPGFCPPTLEDATHVHSLQIEVIVQRSASVGVETSLKDLHLVLDHGMGFAPEGSTGWIRLGLLMILLSQPENELNQDCKSLLLRILDSDNHRGKYLDQVTAATINKELSEALGKITSDLSYGPRLS